MQGSHDGVLSAPLHNPLVAVLIEEHGVTETRYFIDEIDASALRPDEEVTSPIKLASVWRDLDADSMLDALDRASHANQPAPPINDIP